MQLASWALNPAHLLPATCTQSFTAQPRARSRQLLAQRRPQLTLISSLPMFQWPLHDIEPGARKQWSESDFAVPGE